jgi:hypothetical protein
MVRQLRDREASVLCNVSAGREVSGAFFLKARVKSDFVGVTRRKVLKSEKSRKTARKFAAVDSVTKCS